MHTEGGGNNGWGKGDGLDLVGSGLGRRVLADDARVAYGRRRGLDELDPVRAGDDGRVRREDEGDESGLVEEAVLDECVRG